MDFEIRIRRNEKKSVTLELSGKLRSGEPAARLRESIKAELRNGARNILLDMTAVSYVDSSGLGEMVSSLITVQSKGGSLKMTGLNTRSNDVIQTTGLGPVLKALSPSSPPHDRKAHRQNFVIALAIIVVVASFFWIALR